jgi:2-C-methyl-D-erythritol 4-phosphate cytidylyltransferase
MRVAVIIPAAGSSRRFSPADQHRSKLDEDLGGKPVLQRTVELFHARDDVGDIIVAAPADDASFADFSLRHADKLSLFGIKLTRGGQHRTQSVANALNLVSADHSHVAVHDAARPAASQALIDRVFDAAAHHPAVVPGIPLDDTLKRVGPPTVIDHHTDPIAAILGSSPAGPTLHPVLQTLDRTDLMLIQTPQVFTLDLLRAAVAADVPNATDDASLVEHLQTTVFVVQGERRNIKLTVPEDIHLIRSILHLKGPDSRPTHKRF